MQVKQPEFFDIYKENKATDLQELVEGLMSPQANLSPKYFYDELGSVLFDAITLLPEYYPTRTELEILTQQAAQIHAHFPQQAAWVDLGAGNCQKAIHLFAHTLPASYVAVDISVDYLSSHLQDLQAQYPNLDVMGVGMDFSKSLTFPEKLQHHLASKPILALYMGSSLGNFNPVEALKFLKRIANLCKMGQAGSGLLIGIDLIKAAKTIELAYADDLGVTAAFNLNVLRRINHLLNSDFDVRDWQHMACFNAQESRVEMHLQAKKNLTVSWPGHQRIFKQGESIHTENSYKWTVDQFTELLRHSGFANSSYWTDSKSNFALFWAT